MPIQSDASLATLLMLSLSLAATTAAEPEPTSLSPAVTAEPDSVDWPTPFRAHNQLRSGQKSADNQNLKTESAALRV
ncbi:hypothetical protein PSQ90_11370 [Devosia rhodophyticola]|uniref:Uncharacterized protein n=1 Tax=Devosia rhodophyticola TaxID=3026423 RepID=A0ABY7YUB3_9HYPH|nr:hypothetical protein [Devosia rhodophyticola]WDR04901.1 hypothetical protein PSQ90_11370 [Devosia rhodophyticola]